MYDCRNCWNKSDFTEVYRTETHLSVDPNNWDLINSYDWQNDLIEIICPECKNSTEDWNIYYLDHENIWELRNQKVVIN